jgi:hypothetical protein
MDQVVRPWEPDNDIAVSLSEAELAEVELGKVQRRRTTQLDAAMRQLDRHGTAARAVEFRLRQDNMNRVNGNKGNAQSYGRCARCYAVDHVHMADCMKPSFAAPAVQPNVRGDVNRRHVDGQPFQGWIDPLCGKCHMRGHEAQYCRSCRTCGRWGHTEQNCGSGFGPGGR